MYLSCFLNRYLQRLVIPEKGSHWERVRRELSLMPSSFERRLILLIKPYFPFFLCHRNLCLLIYLPFRQFVFLLKSFIFRFFLRKMLIPLNYPSFFSIFFQDVRFWIFLRYPLYFRRPMRWLGFIRLFQYS